MEVPLNNFISGIKRSWRTLILTLGMRQIQYFVIISLLLVFTTQSQSCIPAISPSNIYSGSFTISRSLQSVSPTNKPSQMSYPLGTTFKSAPAIALALSKFEYTPTSGLYFNVRPLPLNVTTSVYFQVAPSTNNCKWYSATLNFLAEAMDSVQAIFKQIDTRINSACCFDQTVSLYFSFQSNITNCKDSIASAFMSGFQININQNVPGMDLSYYVSIKNTTLNSTGIIVTLSFGYYTNLSMVAISYIVICPTDMKTVQGYFSKTQSIGTFNFQIQKYTLKQYNKVLIGITSFKLAYDTLPSFSIIIKDKWIVQTTTLTPFQQLTLNYILLRVSECSDCMDAPFIFNGICVSQCPQGAILFQGSCFVCPPNTQFSPNGCKCKAEYHNSSGNCIKCASTQRWNGTQCVQFDICAAKIGTVWNGEYCVCANSGYYWNGVMCEMAKGYCPPGEICYRKSQIKNTVEQQTASYSKMQVVTTLSSTVTDINIQPTIVQSANGVYLQSARPTLPPQLLIQPPKQENFNPQCSSKMFFSWQQRLCKQCPFGCLTCQSTIFCTSCIIGYENKINRCLEVCGDSRRFVLSCDDGNTLDGDGCSSQCTVEPFYKCSGGSPTTADVCVYTRPQRIIISRGQLEVEQKTAKLEIGLNWLPEIFSGNNCRFCSGVLKGEVFQSQYIPKINISYHPGTSYTFTVSIRFGDGYPPYFELKLLINQALTPYFSGVDISTPLITRIDMVRVGASSRFS